MTQEEAEAMVQAILLEVFGTVDQVCRDRGWDALRAYEWLMQRLSWQSHVVVDLVRKGGLDHPVAAKVVRLLDELGYWEYSVTG